MQDDEAGLSEYKKKRDFLKSPEPVGGPPHEGRMIFVVQKHDARRLHYDLRMEDGGVLLSWAVPKGPSMDPSIKRLAVRTEDHPMDYANFEGMIPKGQYGAGSVIVWDRGTYVNMSQKGGKGITVQEALTKGHLTIQFNGEKLKGGFHLVKTRDDKQWLLMKASDESSIQGHDITVDQPDSVLSGKGIDEISSVYQQIPVGLRDKVIKTSQPPYIDPMLATLSGEVKGRENWIIERKYDGERCIAFKRDEKVVLQTRNHRTINNTYPELVSALENSQVRDFIMDGEIVAFNDDRTDFGLLEQRMRIDDPKAALRTGIDVFYYAFDLMHVWSYDIRLLKLGMRRELLKRFFAFKDPLRCSQALQGPIGDNFQEACKKGWEGIIIKDPESPYRQYRSKEWLKLKCKREQEFVIGGFTLRRGDDGALGALLIGYYKGDDLIYSGRVGTGFNENERRSIFQRLLAFETGLSPFRDVKGAIDGVHWTMPVLVAKVEFREWTREGKLRHPSFRGLKTERGPRSVFREVEAVEMGVGADVKITNPKKVLFPISGITKGLIFDYYEDISGKMLPHLYDRPLTMQRFPNGIDEEGFFQKERFDYFPEWLSGVAVTGNDGKMKTYPLCNDKPSLMYLVNLASITFHVWTSRAGDLGVPDKMVFDLDPGKGPFEEVKEAAIILRDFLAGLDIPTFPMTTGSKGLHLVAPVKKSLDHKGVWSFANAVANAIAMQHGDILTTNRKLDSREGKIYVDIDRNSFSQTSVSPYSVRPIEGAPIAWPVKWSMIGTDELGPRFVNIENYESHLGGEPWKKYGDASVDLEISRRRLISLLEGIRKR